MHIDKVVIENFKCFNSKFEIHFRDGINIIVGNNEAGKSTILEAVHLALTGILNGKYLRNELSQYLFNNEVVKQYINSFSLSPPSGESPPTILIEVYFGGDVWSLFQGNGNSNRSDTCGVALKIEFDSDYQAEYDALVKSGDIKAIPIEYYKQTWKSFARDSVSSRSIPMKSVLIDSSSSRHQNGSDIYISRIIRDDLDAKEKVQIAQAYRKTKESFIEDPSVKAINKKIGGKADITHKKLEVSVDLSTQNSWEYALMTYLDETPFHQVGKGEQCIVKTNLALGHSKAKEANLILLEEPENHLSYSKLNQLIQSVAAKCTGKQIIISTHSSFVANKLGLECLILLHDRRVTRLDALDSKTQEFFRKLPGYQTLRMLLSKKAVLVEGPSDELIFQKAYRIANVGKLPIQDEIDVISVGLTFKRFLEVAKLLNKPVAVITDNDGDYTTKITDKYEDFNGVQCIKIFADRRNKLNTLEPQFVDANKNNLGELAGVVGATNSNQSDLVQYMSKKEIKTEWALSVFESDVGLTFPEYIVDAVKWCNE
tara:strand:+ start:1031 stop:2656 length:1626 start_codon:yes stop_codon:yes gene_type:complete